MEESHALLDREKNFVAGFGRLMTQQDIDRSLGELCGGGDPTEAGGPVLAGQIVADGIADDRISRDAPIARYGIDLAVNVGRHRQRSSNNGFVHTSFRLEDGCRWDLRKARGQ